MTSIAHTPKGYRCYRLVNGLYTQHIGPAFPDLHDAIRYSDQLDAPEPTTPLRASPAEPSDPRPVTPSRSGLVSDGSAGVPRGPSPVEDTGS